MNVSSIFCVIIPLFNKEKEIAASLQSALDQSCPNFQIIVIDDGSTDNSLSIAKSFSDPRLKIFEIEHGGVSAARNFGIDQASAEFIAFLDADDKWERNFLETMQKQIHKYPQCALFASAYLKQKFNQTSIKGAELPEGICTKYFETIFRHFVPWTSAIVVRKTAIKDVGGFPIGMIGGEDEYTWAKIGIKYSMAFTPEVLSCQNNMHPASISRRGKVDWCKESWFDLFDGSDEYRNEYIYKKAITAGIRYSFARKQNKSREIEELTKANKYSRHLWWKLFILNRMPYSGRKILQKITRLMFRYKYKMVHDENLFKFCILLM